MPAKTIHQRNKSTPALTTLMNVGAVRGAIGTKRAALADVGNTTRQNQPAKDDSAINGKESYDKTAISHVIELPLKNNISALSKPAHRPLAVKPSQQAVTTTIVPIKPAAAETIAPKVQPANERKAYPSRNTAVVKEESVTSGQTTTAGEVGVNGKPFRAEDLLAQLKEGISASRASAIDGVLQPNGRLDHSEPFAPVPISSAAQPLHRQALPFLPAQQQIVSASQVEHDILLALEQQAQALEASERNATYTQKHVQPAQGQEYYLDEEDEDLYYEEGYTTARSLKMRGDTTGGATIVLQPRYTAKVQAEIAAAKQLVEGLRTEEDIEDEQWDTSMVAEYGEEIFEYMRTLEVRCA